jgi:hypothetical protein
MVNSVGTLHGNAIRKYVHHSFQNFELKLGCSENYFATTKFLKEKCVFEKLIGSEMC